MLSKYIERLSAHLAAELFQLGDEPGSATKRIQFMGEIYPDREKGQGGLNAMALKAFLNEQIAAYLTEEIKTLNQ